MLCGVCAPVHCLSAACEKAWKTFLRILPQYSISGIMNPLSLHEPVGRSTQSHSVRKTDGQQRTHAVISQPPEVVCP